MQDASPGQLPTEPIIPNGRNRQRVPIRAATEAGFLGMDPPLRLIDTMRFSLPDCPNAMKGGLASALTDRRENRGRQAGSFFDPARIVTYTGTQPDELDRSSLSSTERHQ